MKALRMAITAMLVVMLLFIVATPATASAASVAKVTKSKGSFVKLNNGCTGYAVTGKHMKKGTSLKLKPVSAKSKAAKTFVYGKNKGWSKAKMAKALKSPKNHSVDTSGWKVFKAYKGSKLRYIVAKKTSGPAPKPEAEEPAPQIVKLTVVLESSRPECSGPAYDLDNLVDEVVVSSTASDEKYTADLTGNAAAVSATVDVPVGRYYISFPDLSNFDSLTSGIAYTIDSDVINMPVDVTKDMVKTIPLKPIEIDLECEEPEEIVESTVPSAVDEDEEEDLALPEETVTPDEEKL